jgi:hypothetical protein
VAPAARHNLEMTVTFKLENHKAEALLTVLSENVEATGRYNAISWSSASASRIESIKQEVEAQMDSQ